MATWFWYAVVAAILYGLHQIFTKIASQHIGDGIGGFIVEGTAALAIAVPSMDVVGRALNDQAAADRETARNSFYFLHEVSQEALRHP